MELLVPLTRLWYDAVLDWGLNSGPASTLPLGYRGGGVFYIDTIGMYNVAFNL